MLLVTPRRTAASLSPRELEIGNDLVRGLTPKEIAGRRDISIWTVRTHIESAKVKLGARTTAELTALLARGRGEDLRTA